VFNFIGNIWTNERNRLTVLTGRRERTTLFSHPYTPVRSLKLQSHQTIIKAAQSDAKYKPYLSK
jgi:hypothetical protein